MSRITRTQRYIIIGGGGILVLLLLYRYFKGQQGGGGGTPMAADGEVGAMGAQLGGQEQADMAGLQNELGNFQSDFAEFQAQEASDIGAIASQQVTDRDGLQGMLDALGGQLGGFNDQIAAIATGHSMTPRNNPMVRIRTGGPFARYYKRVTGRNAPARVSATNFVLQAWRNRIPARNLVRHPASHSPSHAANRPNSHQPKPRQHAQPATRHGGTTNATRSGNHSVAQRHATQPTHANGGAAAPRPAPHPAPAPHRPAAHRPASRPRNRRR